MKRILLHPVAVFTAVMLVMLVFTARAAQAPVSVPTPAKPKIADIKNPDVSIEVSKDLQINALKNRAANSDYNAQLQQFRAVPQIKALVDEMQESAQAYLKIRNELFKSVGIPEVDWDKYEVDLTQNRDDKKYGGIIVRLPEQPQPGNVQKP